MTTVNTMDYIYVYIIGYLGILIGVFVFSYYLQKQIGPIPIITSRHIESYQNKEHIQEDHNIECDGDKCFIKHRQTKYDKCDGEKSI